VHIYTEQEMFMFALPTNCTRSQLSLSYNNAACRFY